MFKNFILVEGIDYNSFSNPECAKFIVSTLVHNSLQKSDNHSIYKPMPLYGKILNFLFSDDRTGRYKKTLDELIKLGFILISNNQYIKGKKSKEYAILESVQENLYNEPISDKLRKKLQNQRNERTTPIENKVLRHLCKYGLRVSIYDYIDNYFDSTNFTHFFDKKGQLVHIHNFSGKSYSNLQHAELWHLANIQNIVEKNWVTSIDSNGRIYHNFTSLPRHCKGFIYHKKGFDLIELDLSNSQPFFLACLLQNENINKDEFNLYKNLVCGGEIYNFIKEGSGYTGNMKDFKVAFFRDIFFSNEVIFYSKIYQFFKNEFPEITNFIDNYRKKSGKHLACKLQEVESEVFIQSVFPKLHTKKIDSFTRHDSIICPQQYAEEVEKLIKEACYDKYVITPKVKIEQINRI